MENPLPDRTVILIILSTLLLVFTLVFTFLPPKNKFENELQWRESGESLGQVEANENENANIIKYKI